MGLLCICGLVAIREDILHCFGIIQIVIMLFAIRRAGERPLELKTVKQYVHTLSYSLKCPRCTTNSRPLGIGICKYHRSCNFSAFHDRIYLKGSRSGIIYFSYRRQLIRDRTSCFKPNLKRGSRKYRFSIQTYLQRCG